MIHISYNDHENSAASMISHKCCSESENHDKGAKNAPLGSRVGTTTLNVFTNQIEEE